MKNKIVLVPFPFDDLSGMKLRPAVCLTDSISAHRHIVLAFITSRVPSAPSKFDVIIESSDADFAATGLKVSSTIKTHRLMTLSHSSIRRELGEITSAHRTKLDNSLRQLFDIHV